jgi:hypothetical protein
MHVSKMGRTFPRFGVIVSSVNSELAGADLLVCFSLRLDQRYQFFAGGEISLLEGVADSLNQPGLAELLRYSGDYSQFIQANSPANFSIIARGAISSNPGELFLNSTFEKMLTQLRQEFDYILIGSSPMFAADNATTLAPKVDGTLFVVRSRFFPRPRRPRSAQFTQSTADPGAWLGAESGRCDGPVLPLLQLCRVLPRREISVRTVVG